MKMTDNVFAKGQCLCGQVKFSVAKAPLKMAQCHCHDCQRSTGSGHVSNSFFKKSDVTINGETSHYVSDTDSGDKLTRQFCPNCGSRLFGESSAVDSIMSITAGVFDDNSWYQPMAIVYNKRKPIWDFMDERLPVFDGMPPPPPK